MLNLKRYYNNHQVGFSYNFFGTIQVININIKKKLQNSLSKKLSNSFKYA